MYWQATSPGPSYFMRWLPAISGQSGSWHKGKHEQDISASKASMRICSYNDHRRVIIGAYPRARLVLQRLRAILNAYLRPVHEENCLQVVFLTRYAG